MTTGRIKNSFESIGEIDASVPPSTLVLKLCLTKHRVKYFVVSSTHNQIIFLGNYTLHHISSFDEMAERFERIFEKDDILQLPFSRVVIGSDEDYVLAPTQFSELLKNEDTRSQKCGNVEILFSYDTTLFNTIKRLFHHVQLAHLNSVFLELALEQKVSPNRLFVNVAGEYIDVILFEPDNSLRLMNRYQYRSASDFIYFVLLCCDELNIDRELCELVLAGEIDIRSQIYELCFRYFRTVSFITPPEDIHFSNAFDSYARHLHYHLYNLNL